MEKLYRYNKLNEYLKEKYGERTLKICIDGLFTCPNRDGSLGKEGCIFCSQEGSGEHIHKFYKSRENIDNSTEYISNQIRNYLSSYKAQRANKFIAYFQNYTNTYDSIINLKRKYQAALIDDRIVCLSVATRPDCINEDICKLLVSFKDMVDVWVELGLQTFNDDIGIFINRGYNSECFTKAINLLNKYKLDATVHIMIGLPNETEKDIENTVKFLNKHDYQGIKIHSTYVIKNTKLAELYLNREYQPISLEYYIKNASYVLTHINPNVIVHKISGDAPKDLLIAPEWNSHKKLILNGIDRYLKENDLTQGCFFFEK